MIRRDVLAGLMALATATPLRAEDFGLALPKDRTNATPFSFDVVRAQALERASKPYVMRPMIPAPWRDLSYDDFSHIWFPDRNALWNDTDASLRVDAFTAGLYFQSAVQINIVEGGFSQVLPYDIRAFDKTDKFPDLPIDETMGYSGFRLRAELEHPDIFTEFMVMQGASYFRAIGTGQIYGLSARGLAIDTAEPTGEEFPDFVSYWIERPGPGKRSFTIYALLDSPGASGAYKFTVRPGQTLEMDVEAELHARRDLAHIGVAPLTSMFLFDETNRNRFDDFRPAVHDNDGLLIWNGAGEILWRALANPLALQVSSFGDKDPKGFGLMQRARKFDDFADMVALYERRPGVWVIPGEGWGEGAITLVELPTVKEINDNIVAYWRPKDVFKAGTSRFLTYRLNWGGEPELPGALAHVTNTRMGAAYEHGKIATIDFAPTDNLPAEVSDLKAIVTNSAGKMLSKPLVQINPETGGPRVALTFDPGEEPVIEFRVQLVTAVRAYSEVWLYRWTA